MIGQQKRMPVDPQHAAECVRVFCDEHDIPFRDSFTASQACELLQRLDYDCVPATIGEFIRKGYVSLKDHNALAPVDIYIMAGALEHRRRWKVTPSLHDPKKSGARLTLEQAEADEVNTWHDLDQHTLEDLLIQSAICENRQVREVLHEAIKAKMDVLGFIEE